MISNTEVLIQSVETYVLNTVDELFGISSIPAQTFIKYGVRNVMNKYKVFIDIFTDNLGQINTPLLFNALKAEIEARGGIEFFNIKFTEKDVDQLISIYKELSGNAQKP